MKKYFSIFIILFLILIPGVKADSSFDLTNTNKSIYDIAVARTLYYNETYLCDSYSSCYDKALELFNLSGFDYYAIDLYFDYSNSTWTAHMTLHTFNINQTDSYTTFLQSDPSRLWIKLNDTVIADINSGSFCGYSSVCSFYQLYDTNYNFTSVNDLIFTNFYSSDSSDNLIIKNGSPYPLLKNLFNYNSYNEYLNDFPSENTTEVDLNNYEYVILVPRDLTKKDSYNVNLQVKGMVGITPVYEFGTAEKDSITDRCNISYSDYTDYRLSILKSDIDNNAVYYVKSCEDNSSFKFNNSDFVIYYATSENSDDLVISVGGFEYHTIPFDKLTNSANLNEENNFIPGESERFKLLDIVDNLTDTLDGIWKSFVTFMSFVTKMFNTLPIEFRAIALTTFTTGCILGLIKILKG